MSLPLVAIVGAPNVGKSTLFNRLTGRRRAIVTDLPGMTRDRLYGDVVDGGRRYGLIDTGGLTPGADQPFAREIEAQADVALSEAALILFVVDARAGTGAFELELAGMLRRREAPVILVANKVDAESVEAEALALSELGLGAPVAISAEHGRNVGELQARILDALPAAPDGDAPDGDAIGVAIVGRPNVGKSSLLNRLVGEERVVVSDLAGTTRDAIDSLLELDGRRYRLIDTAGIRRPGRIRGKPERFSVARARDVIERADVVVLVLDGSEPITAQDTHIAGAVVESYRPLVVAVNKWDLVEGREAAAKRWLDDVAHRLRFAKGVPTIFISALTGQRVRVLLDRVDDAYAAAGVRVPTPALNRWLRTLRAGRADGPPRGSFRLYYATQVGTHPPTFVFFCNDPALAHFSTRRQIANGLRRTFDLGAAPLRVRLRRRRSEGQRG